MELTCLKCGSEKYYMRTAIFPEKDTGLKLHLGAYYLKICEECGYTEMYSAAILDKGKGKNVQSNPAT